MTDDPTTPSPHDPRRGPSGDDTNDLPLSSTDAGGDTTRDLRGDLPPTWREPAAPIGQRVGPYRLEHRLGQGGFGEVWRAIDERYDRTVAVKFIRPDRLDERTIKRFEVERESLKLVAHPNVARILDAGFTDDGRPFLAMEYIEGEPIVRYCDRRQLPIEARLRLFASVCDAVHHIHQQGLLHRDLSPDNILVVEPAPGEGGGKGENAQPQPQPQPQPKILDFGVAKPLHPELRLSEEPMSLEIGLAIGKWLYMSPEQAEGGVRGIDVRSDIYALGIILYQLLAGVLPIDPQALASRAFRAAIEYLVQTPRPDPATRFATLEPDSREAFARQRGAADAESLLRTLTGRLRFLPLTAIHLDRARRFSSAAAMADDIRRYLRDEDFAEARKDPWSDRVVRGAKRHWLPLSAAAALFLAVTGGLIGTLYGLGEAQRGRDAAETASNETTSLLGVISEGLADADSGAIKPETIGTTFTGAADRVRDRLAATPDLQYRIQLALGQGLVRLGRVTDAVHVLDLARDSATKAGEGPRTLAWIDLLSTQAQWRDDRAEESLATATKALGVLRAAGAEPSLIADALKYQGGALKHSGSFDEAASVYQEAIALRQAESPRDDRELAILGHDLALVDAERALALMRRPLPDMSDEEAAAARAGDRPEIARLLRASLAAERTVWSTASAALGATDADALAPAAEVCVGLLRLSRFVSDADEAKRLLDESIATYATVLPGLETALGLGHWRVLDARGGQAVALQLAGRHSEALAVLVPLIDEFRVLRRSVPGSIAKVTEYLATSLVATGDEALARHHLRRTLDMLEASDDPDVVGLAAPLRSRWATLLGP